MVGGGRHGCVMLGGGGWRRNDMQEALFPIALADGGSPEQHDREQPLDPAASAQIHGH